MGSLDDVGGDTSGVGATLDINDLSVDKMENLLDVLKTEASSARCGLYLNNISNLSRQNIYQKLECDRLNVKFHRIKVLHLEYKMSWENILLYGLMKYMGDMANRSNYEQLAIRLDISIMLRERESLHNIEALLIAAAGLHKTLPNDEESKRLVDDGEYLLHKYKIEPLKRSQWRKIAPYKSPIIIRLSQIANIIHRTRQPFNSAINCKRREDIFDIFFGVKASPEISKYFNGAPYQIGADLCDIIGINAVVPLLFAYGAYSNRDDLVDAASNLNETIPAENNSIIRRWRNYGLDPKSAYETQALIELYNNHCLKKKCNECQVYKHICSPSSEIKKVPVLIDIP